MVSRNTLILFLTIFLLGCRPVQAPPTTTPVPEATAIPATPVHMPEEAALIRNAPYQLGTPDSLQIVQLKDGKYERGAPGGADYISVQVTDFAAIGDLNADGTDETVALVAENFGGTGVFVFLVVYTNITGKPTFFTSRIVDDRPQLNGLTIENGEIFLDATIHGTEDPMCCPTLKTTRHYKLVNDQLDMTDFTSFTPDGKPRTITIESPVNGTEVRSRVQMKGNVAIAPFENNLTYSIKDGAGVEISRGAITVTTADLGGPGTFDVQIPLGSILTDTVVTIEVRDLSAADGSLLAMDSVELVVK